MELWIRSQNKHTLIRCNYITTLEKDIYGNTEYTIINEDELELGKYDNEKRLLEVLDEIQDILKPRIITKFRNELKYDEDKELNTTYIPFDTFENTEIQELKTYVYEMPEE